MSKTALARSSVYTSGGTINATSLETDFDTNMMLFQQQDERLDRTLIAPVDDATSIDMTLPNKDARKGKSLGFDSTSGNPTAIEQLTGAAVNVSTVSAGGSATASVSVSGGTATFALGIPTGASGATGAAGAAGADSTVAGPQGAAGADGDNTVTIKDEGSALSTAASTLNFVGAGVTASGTGAEKTITITDNNTTYSVGDGGLTQNNFTNTLKSKLDFIEASATADQTASEIRTLVESASDSNVFTDADHSKLNAIAASANNYSHPNHSGEVSSTGDGATVIADNVVDEANLKVSNTPTNGYALTAQSGNTGGLTWAAMTGGGSGEANQNAFSSVAVSGQSTVAADAATDTLNLAAGSNVTITTNAGSDTVTIAATDTNTTYSVGDGGLTTNDFTDADHSKLNNIAVSANNYVHPNHSGEVTSTADGATVVASNVIDADNLKVTGNGSTSQFLRSDGDGTFTWATPTDTDTVYTLPLATDTVRGGIELFSNTDQSVAANTVSTTAGRTYGVQLNSANQAVVNVPWSDTDTNTTYSVGDGGLTTNDFTNADHSKLNAIAASANNYVHPNHSGEVTSSADGATVVASDVIDADNLKVTGNGTTSQYLRSDGDGTFTWATPTDTDTNTTYSVGDGGLTTNDFTNADHSKLNGIAASANNYVHPNHSGEVTSTADGATVIADNVVDEANLKVSNSPTNGYMLTAQSGNTGGLTWAAASSGGGGADLYTANESSPSAQPSATGTNSIAIGDGAISSGNSSFAGPKSRAVGTNSFAIGIGTNSASYGVISGTIAMGNSSKTNGVSAIALGGYLCAATNHYAIAMGKTAVASGERSLAIHNSDAVADDAVAIGEGARAGSAHSFSLGENTNAGNNNAFAFGLESVTRVKGAKVYASGKFATQGDAQSSHYVLRCDTTDATATVMTTNNSTASTSNQVWAGNQNSYSSTSDTCVTFHGTIVAMQNGAQSYGSWEIKGLLVNDGGTATLPNSAITVISNTSNWGLALSADNTKKSLKVEVTGEASHNIRWVASITTAEVTFA
jgi:hypothetical protein